MLSFSDADLESEAALDTADQGEDVLSCIVGLSRIRHMLEACAEPAKQDALSTILTDILKVTSLSHEQI